MYNRKIAPTVSKIKKEIEDTIKISKSTLTLTLLDLGYKYKKCCDNRRLLYDQRSVINDRCNYLRKIRKFREVGYEIVYLDETWVNQVTGQNAPIFYQNAPTFHQNAPLFFPK
jgi:hypothetical protein